MEVKLSENIKYFPGLSEDVLNWLKNASEYITLDLSHKSKNELLNEKFEVKIGLPEGLKFAPRICGDEIVSIDIVKDYETNE